MIGQAEKQYWQGGRVYGYKLVPVLDPARTDPYGNPDRVGTRLELDPEQATGCGGFSNAMPRAVADQDRHRTQPARRLPARAAYHRHYPRTPSWSALALHGELSRGTGLLNNNLYRGVYVWNRSRREKDPETNRRAHVVRDRSEWIETPMPHLRIIEDDLWERAHTRRVA